MVNILIAEDERDIRGMMAEYLSANGYNCFEAEDGEEALSILENNHIDLLITDIMMPNIDGFALTGDLRAAEYKIPILMVTAKETIDDKEQGFISGTDDYMVKPIILKEMLLRVKSLLRRSEIASEKTLSFGEVTLDFDSFTVTFGTVKQTLPNKEFILLFKLLSNPNKIFTRARLMDEIWGYDSDSDDSTIKVHISRLRNKFADCKDFSLVAVKGIGYKAVIR